jgi:predicted nucleic acid-binding protein
VVLVDTSVWIRFLAGRRPFSEELDRLLDQDLVLSHELVAGELLIGDSGGRTRFLREYELFHRAEGVSHSEVVRFVRDRHLHGRGVGWIDVHLLASAVVSHSKLWTADARLAEIATELGVAYEAAASN